MTLEKFQDILLTLDIGIRTLRKYDYGDIRTYDRYSYRDEDPEKFDALYVDWSTGGQQGGNCWNDDEPTGYTTGNPPEELKGLDTILEKIKPDLTFLQYKSLTKLIQTGSRREGEYYGNCTDYSYKYIKIEDLYNYMKEKGWLDEYVES